MTHQTHIHSFNIFTDGSALSNSRESPAGWAAYLATIDVMLSGGMRGTNNMAELTAVKSALLEVIDKAHLVDGQRCVIFSDSLYVIKLLLGKNKAKANLELVNECKALIASIRESNHKVGFIHVKAHRSKNQIDPSDRKELYKWFNNRKVDTEAKRQASIIANNA